jgi:hypothetical protein
MVNDTLEALRTYLRDHFPEMEWDERLDTTMRATIFHGQGEPACHLAATETFLEGNPGINPMDVVRRENLARTLRLAQGKLVILTATGVTATGAS